MAPARPRAAAAAAACTMKVTCVGVAHVAASESNLWISRPAERGTESPVLLLSSSSSSYHYYPGTSVSGGREDSRVLCPATILVFIQNTHIDSWAENPTTYPSRVECSKVLCPDREFYTLDNTMLPRAACSANQTMTISVHATTVQKLAPGRHARVTTNNY